MPIPDDPDELARADHNGMRSSGAADSRGSSSRETHTSSSSVSAASSTSTGADESVSSEEWEPDLLDEVLPVSNSEVSENPLHNFGDRSFQTYNQTEVGATARKP